MQNACYFHTDTADNLFSTLFRHLLSFFDCPGLFGQEDAVLGASCLILRLRRRHSHADDMARRYQNIMPR